jgi:K+-sensing histidine kinase KdpD
MVARSGTAGIAARRRHDQLALGAAVLAPLLTCAILVPFREHFPNTDAALILVAVVVAVAADGHRVAGLLAAASAAVWFDFFLTRPYEHFSITTGNDVRTTVLLLLVGAAVTELAARGRRHRVIAVTDAAYLTGIHENADQLADGADSGLIGRVAVQLTELLGLRACRFVPGELSGHPPILQADGSLRWGLTRWDVDKEGFPRDDIALAVRHRGRVLGHFLLTPTPGTAPSRDARLVAVILAGQAGTALAGRDAFLRG